MGSGEWWRRGQVLFGGPAGEDAQPFVGVLTSDAGRHPVHVTPRIRGHCEVDPGRGPRRPRRSVAAAAVWEGPGWRRLRPARRSRRRPCLSSPPRRFARGPFGRLRGIGSSGQHWRHPATTRLPPHDQREPTPRQVDGLAPRRTDDAANGSLSPGHASEPTPETRWGRTTVSDQYPRLTTWSATDVDGHTEDRSIGEDRAAQPCHSSDLLRVSAGGQEADGDHRQ